MNAAVGPSLQHVAVRLDHAPGGRMNASLEDPGRKLGDAAERTMPKSEDDRANIIAIRYEGEARGF